MENGERKRGEALGYNAKRGPYKNVSAIESKVPGTLISNSEFQGSYLVVWVSKICGSRNCRGLPNQNDEHN